MMTESIQFSRWRVVRGPLENSGAHFAISRIPQIVSSASSETSRHNTAATSASASPQTFESSSNKSASRTTIPPGSIETKPATIDSATTATSKGRL